MFSRTLTRRSMLRASAVAGAGVALAACQPKIVEVTKIVTQEKVVEKPVEKLVQQTVVVTKQVEKVVQQTVIVQKEAPKGKASIRFTTDWYGGVRGNLTNQALAQWKDKVRPDINIAYEPCPRVQDRLRVDFAAGTPPDVMLFAPELYASFGDQLLELDAFWSTADAKFKDDLLGFDPSFSLNGKLVAMPYQHNIWQPSINVDLFKKAGIKMPWEYNHDGDKWWDWNDYLASATAIKALGADIWGIQNNGNTYMGWGPWMRTNGVEWVDPAWPKFGEYVKSTLDNPAAIEAFQFYVDVVCKYKVSLPLDVVKTLQTTLQVSPFYAGKVGIIESTSEASIRSAKMNAHRVCFPRSPKTKKANHHQGNCPNVAWKKTQWPKECWDFMSFMSGPWCQKQIGIQGGAMPGCKSVLADPDYYKEFPAIAREAMLQGAKENTCMPGAFLNMEEWRKDVEAIAMDALICKIPGAQAIKEMHDIAVKVLAKRA